MSEEAYNKKLADLQKYIPFMENMIAQLKDPKWKPREAQLNKMESLYNMITDKNKKWKYETLLKCEEVIMKLQSKVKANKPIFPAEKKENYMNPERLDNISSTVSDIMKALKFNNARAKLNCEMSTPKSPSPIREVMPLHSPKIIPFEAMNEPIRKSTNIIDPNELSVTWNCDVQDRYVKEKPDIYSSAAKSLGVNRPAKISIFDRLGPVVPDASSDTPLLSDADLEMLRTGEDIVLACQNDRQIRPTPKAEKSLHDINLKLNTRITPVPASKPKINLSENADKVEVSQPVKKTEKTEKTKNDKHKDKDASNKSCSSNKSPKAEKIITSDIFGNCLSSIDNKILEDSKKKDKKKDERRHSTEHKKEKHHNESKHHHHKHKDKDKKKEVKLEDPRLKKDKEKKKDVVPEKPLEKVDIKEKPPEEKLLIPIEIQPEKPKRLADKYNPKPRKHVEVEIPEKIINDVPSFEIRDPRKRPPHLLPTPPSILGNPPFPQTPIVNHNSFSMNMSRNSIPNLSGTASQLPIAMQPQMVPPPKPVPLMALNVSSPHAFQSPPLQAWPSDNNIDYVRPNPVPVFEPPIKPSDPRRQSFLDNSERSIGEIRRQPKFSPPPPPISPVHTPFSNSFVPPLFHNQQAPLFNEINFVPPPIQRNLFEIPGPLFQQSRFEGHSNRFDIPAINSHVNQNVMSRKNFCPFEPLDNSRENQNIFQSESARRNENHPGGFRSNYNQYNNNRQDNRFDRNLDRYGRKPSREIPKVGPKDDNFSKDRKFGIKEEQIIKVEDNGDKQKLNSKDSESDLSIKERSHTKYDEIYSKLDNEKETFSSPLESLYSNSKTSVKSIQSFKIPKKPKPEPPPQPPPPPVEEQKLTERNLDQISELKHDTKPVVTEEHVGTSKSESSSNETDENVIKKSNSKALIVSEDTDNEDDIPLWKRVKRRTKTMPKNKLIDESDEDHENENDVKEEELQEDTKKEESISTRRVTRQSAIKANKLITKRVTPARRVVRKAKPNQKGKKLNSSKNESDEKIEEQAVQEVVDEDASQVKTEVKIETLDKSKEEVIQNDDKDLGKSEIDNKEQLEVKTDNKITETNVLEEVKLKQEEDNLQTGEKQPNEVQKAKEELLTEAKKKNLNLNDQGAEVLQFILMNYKKIKKIFRSDSSSDEEEKERKKKKKRRDKSSSDDEKESKEKRKHKEKHSSDDEKEIKEKKKQKEKYSSDDENEIKEKRKQKEKLSSDEEKEIKEKRKQNERLSSDDEKEIKEKRKQKEKLSSDDEKEIKEKRKQKEKLLSDDEKEIKEKRKQKEKLSSDDENDIKAKQKKQASEDEAESKAVIIEKGKPDIQDEESKKSEAKGNQPEMEEEEAPEKEDDTAETVEENTVDNESSVEEEVAAEEVALLKSAIKGPARKVKKATGPKGRVLRKEKQGNVTVKQTLVTPTKKARRSELDKLHDDIKEMLMGGEVTTTSTGKRACTMPKDDSEELRKDWNEDLSITRLEQNPFVIPAKSVRVLIEKTDIEKLLTKDVVKEDTTDSQEDNDNALVMPKLEKMVSTPVRNVNKKKILRRKKHRWATGFLKRKNKTKNSAVEDKIEGDASPLIRGRVAINKLLPHSKLLHDKNYFIQDAKPSCKLCPFKGKLVIQHYKSVHPDAEVIISRMNPTVTEHLIKEARDNNYDSIVLTDIPGQKKKRFGYKCPFMCSIGTTMDYCENYYDHITSHTGEYRFFCPFCPFSTSNPRNLRGHMIPQHNSNLENYGKPLTPAPPSSKYVFGYVCRQCHYVQTQRQRLEKHLERYHNNTGAIIKINLSLVCMEIEEVDSGGSSIISEPSPTTKKILNKQDHVNESIESVVGGAGIIRLPEPALVKDLNIFDLIKQIEADEPPPVLVKMEPIEVEPDIDTLLMPQINIESPPVPANQADLTVFMCKSDLPVEDEQTIEQKRLKKMNEIQEKVKPSRTSIVDRLQSRLDSNTGSDLVASATITPVSPVKAPVVVSSSKPPPLIPLDRSKKSLDSIPKKVIPPEVVMAPKKAAPISSIINRLQDKLLPIPSTSKQAAYFGDQDDTNSTLSSTLSSPLSSPTKHLDTNVVSSALNIGPITITFNKNNEILYSCFVPFCVFNTMKASIFEYHCKVTHKTYIYDHMKCDVCQVKIEHEDDYVSMLDIYKHVNTSHADFMNRAARNEETTETASSELASVTENSMTANEESTASTSNTVQQTDNDSGTKYPFVITNVTSGEPQPSTSKEPDKFAEFTLPHEVPNLISQADTGSGPKFPFIITSVTSLAKKPTPTTSNIALAISLQTTTASSTTLLNTLTTSGPVISTILAMSPRATTPIQTSPIMKPYTITSAQPIPAMVPIILNPMAPENDVPNKIQLPIISCVQSLAPVKKDTIRPVPLNQLTSDNWTAQTNLTPEKRPLSSSPITTGTLTVLPNTGPEKRKSTTPVNVVSLISSDGKTLMLKDIPMTEQEKLSPRKSKVARDVLLQAENQSHFYKCPQFFCFFSTHSPKEYSIHLSMHKELANTFTFCLHCDYKTSYKLYMIHLEIHHGGSAYACGRCFYRSTNAAFVTAHSKMRHVADPIVIQTPSEHMPPRINNPKLPPLKSILKHYVCGAPGCGMKTIFSNIYYEHITTAHPELKKITCGICKSALASFSVHWATHNIHSFHCRYCKVGSKSLADIVNHQAKIHFKNDYCVVYRRFVPNPIYPDKPGSSYNVKDDATYDRLYIIYGGNGADENPLLEEDSLFELPTVNISQEESSQPQETDADPLFLNVDVSEEILDAPSKKAADGADKEINVGTSDEPEITLVNADMDDAITDPLSLDMQDDISDDDMADDKDPETDTPKYDPKAAKHCEEYSGTMLYKCICNMAFEDRIKFKQHIIACQEENNFKCAHCGLKRKSYRTLLTHIQEHGRKRFKCSLCQYKHFCRKFVKDHMIVEHNVYDTMMLPASVTTRIDYASDDFVLRPKVAKLTPIKKVNTPPVVAAAPPPPPQPPAPVEAPAVNKTIFFPKDIGQLPRPPIYQAEVSCGVCNYATKVKSNMVRHLQAHQNEQEVPETAPVNPVPCLEKSEKMFDKMVNLAMSSHSGGKVGAAKLEKPTTNEETNMPNFVPINKRFVCGAEGCNYLCPEEGMLRRHLTTFHSQELKYTCLHCKKKLFEDKLINVDMVLKHLKLHDAHLYCCGCCTFIHNLKHKVERHMVDKHSDKPPTYIVIREIVKETEKGAPTGEKDDGKKPWKCGMCKFRGANDDEMKSHTRSTHNVNAKHKCSLCEFDNDDVSSFGKHFETSHNGQTVDMIVCYYKEDEVPQQKPEADLEFNTTPLWQRNKTVKHIRGILLEETNNKISKTPGPKKLRVIKPKKSDNVESKNEIGSDYLPLIVSSPIKKPPPKRRKSNLGNKTTPVSKKKDKTANSIKEVIDDVISRSISIESSDVRNVNDNIISKQVNDDIGQKKLYNDDLSVLKQTPIVISNKKLNSSNSSGFETAISSGNSNTKVTTDTNQKAKILSVSYFKVDLNEPKVASSENSQKKTEAFETPHKNEDIIEIVDDKVKSNIATVKKYHAKTKSVPSVTSKKKANVIDISDDITPPTGEATKRKLEDGNSKMQGDTEIIDISDDKFEESTTNKKLNIGNIIDLSDDKIENSPVFNKKKIVRKTPLVTVHLKSANNAPYKTVKAKTDTALMPISCNINLDDSSAEDSDVIEVFNESDPLTDSVNLSECTTPNDGDQTQDPLILNPNLDSCLKNIKVVSVCSLKDMPLKDVEETADVEAVEVIEDDNQAPSKKLKLDISHYEIETMTKADLLNGNFVGTYGPYGAPWNGNYKCPLCEKFVCNSTQDFTTHMYGELQYGIYKCAVCDYRDNEVSTVAQHCEESHENIDKENMVLTAPDQQIVDWVAKLLVFQTRILTLDRDEVRNYCHFCDYKCDNPSDMRKHHVRHWCIKPFTCPVCKHEAVAKSALERHAKRCHPGVNVSSTEGDIGESVVIKRIRWNGRTERADDATQNYETFEMDKNLDEVKDVLLSCCYCNTRGKLDELRTHTEREHPEKEFKVHRYRCNYCTSTFISLRTVDQHFILCHSGMHRNYTEVSESVKAFRCPKCPVSDDKFTTIKDHVRSHYKTLKCLYCDLTTVYWKTMKKHYNEVHSTQNFEFLYLISVDQSHEKDLISNAGHTNRKRKRLDEDILKIQNSPTRTVLDEKKIEETPPVPKIKQVARKSTGYAKKPSEIESHYGKKPSIDDFSNITTTVDVMGAPVTMNITKFAKILDIFPIVLVEDCRDDL